MAEILLISKPLVPPWNDSGKNLVRDVALGLRRHHPHVMGTNARAPELSSLTTEPVYGKFRSGFSLSTAMQARVFLRLTLGRAYDLWHFFFAPNPRSSHASRFLKQLRRMPTVHSICSAPREDLSLNACLFADRHVVLSRHTEQRLLEAGISEDRVVRIPPGIQPLSLPDDSLRSFYRKLYHLPQDAPLVLFAGDLEFGQGAELTLRTLARLPKHLNVHGVMACRAKTERAQSHEQRLRQLAHELGLERSLTWLGEVPNVHALLFASDIVLLPSETLYAKMDYPLVLLEAMCLKRPVIVARGTAAAELAEQGGALAVEPHADVLTATVQHLLDDTSARDNLGHLGRENVLHNFNRDTMAKSYEALYDTLLP